MIFNETNTTDGKFAVLDYLRENRFDRVIDVGGAMNPWGKEFVTAYFDILDESSTANLIAEGSKLFIGDICDYEQWEALANNAKENGKYDFAICTQVIEDIRNPLEPIRWLPRIAKEGFISVPCKHSELCSGIECSIPEDREVWGTDKDFRGYFHHRWIYTIIKGVLVAFPKLNFIEVMKGLEWATEENRGGYFYELSFWWKDNIPFRFFNDDYLGPNGYSVLDQFRNQIKDGI